MDTATVKLNRAIKVPLYPTPEQEDQIIRTFGCCRFVWNHMLSDEQEFYAATGKHFIVTPAKYKTLYPFLGEVDSLALCNEQLAIKRAFTAFFDKDNKAKRPNFKSKKRSRNSYTTNVASTGATNLVVGEDFVKLPKLGYVAANIYRKPGKNWVFPLLRGTSAPSQERSRCCQRRTTETNNPCQWYYPRLAARLKQEL